MNFIEIMTCIFIYNPVSGKGKIVAQKDYIVKELKEKFDKVDVYATKCAGDMSRVAREAVGKYDAIIFSGGDGTFNELLQGIAAFDELPILGYIPTGTTNDIAHTLGIPIRLRKALKTIKNGVALSAACGSSNGIANYFGLICLATIPNAVYYPIKSAGELVLAALMAVIIFKEKLRPAQYVGVGLGVLALIFINIT